MNIARMSPAALRRAEIDNQRARSSMRVCGALGSRTTAAYIQWSARMGHRSRGTNKRLVAAADDAAGPSDIIRRA
jgi:hypothetical protein